MEQKITFKNTYLFDVLLVINNNQFQVKSGATFSKLHYKPRKIQVLHIRDYSTLVFKSNVLLVEGNNDIEIELVKYKIPLVRIFCWVFFLGLTFFIAYKTGQNYHSYYSRNSSLIVLFISIVGDIVASLFFRFSIIFK